MKNIFNYNKVVILLLISILLSGCAKTTYLRCSSDYRDKLNCNKNIAVFLPEVLANQIEATSSVKRLDSYEYILEEEIIESLIPKLQDKNYNVTLLDRKFLHNNKLLHYAIDLKDFYKESLVNIYKDRLLIPVKEAYQLDLDMEGAQQLKHLADNTKCGLILYVEFYATSRSNANQMTDLALSVLFRPLAVSMRSTGGHPFIDSSDNDFHEISTALVIIADAATSKVIWSNVYSEKYSMFDSMGSHADRSIDRKRLNNIFNQILKDLPEYGEGF